MEQFAYCKVAVSPVRAAASDASEMVTQLLFGEIVTILESDQQWRKIQSFHDNYEGWVDSKQVRPLTKKEAGRWQDGISVLHALTATIETPWGEQTITRGAFIPSEQESEFNIGNDRFRFSQEPAVDYATKSALAMSYLNAPYLWGGKSPLGIDCSGFVQTVFRGFDYNLPRDAFQQAEMGQEIAFEDRQKEDLAFFINAKGRIHHVGILLSQDEIIHASGCVRTDDFTAEGIRNRETGEISHKLFSLKRI